MPSRENPLYWSFPLGTWLSTRVRMSVFFPLILLVLCFRLGVQLGLITSLVLFVSVLVHEFAHVLAARYTGGGGDEILVWPLGGLAYVHPANTYGSVVLTAAAAPLANLVLCGASVLGVLQNRAEGFLAEALNPFVMPNLAFESQVVADLLVVVFVVNWVLFLVNLIPIYPLDGGQILQATLYEHLGHAHGAELYAKIGTVCAVLLMVVGLLLPEPHETSGASLVFIGAVVLVLNHLETLRHRVGDEHDESFMGYDFSQGYTSLEKEFESTPKPRRPGLVQRWLERRRTVKEQRQQEFDAMVDQQLDFILQKVHDQGIDALTKHERALLNKASSRYQRKERNS